MNYTLDYSLSIDGTYIVSNIETHDDQPLYIVIPKNEPNGKPVTDIGNYVFYNCTTLTQIKIPESITYISNFAFENCINLKTITVDENNKTYYSQNNGTKEQQNNISRVITKHLTPLIQLPFNARTGILR